jgi:hypothetical protein
VPAYSGGNRWVGALALRPLPVPPPLHKMAQHRLADHVSGRSHVQLADKVIPAGTAQRALSLLSEVLGDYGDVPRVNQSLALARDVRRGKARPESWPHWARNAVLRYAANPGYFSGARVTNLETWGLAFHTDAFGPSRNAKLDTAHRPGRSTHTPTALKTDARRPAHRTIDVIDVRAPAVLDPGPALDGMPLGSCVADSLARVGWDAAGVLRERWLRVALMHASYVYERAGGVTVNARLLNMLAGLGHTVVPAFRT